MKKTKKRPASKAAPAPKLAKHGAFVRIAPRTRTRLRRFCVRQGVSMGEFTTQLISQYIDRAEAKERARASKKQAAPAANENEVEG